MTKTNDKSPALILPGGRLWPNMPFSKAPCSIDVFGASGEYKSGKTLLGMTIAPGVHPEGHKFAGKPRTRLYDMELSSGTYGGSGADRIDVMDEVQRSLKDPNSASKTKMPTELDIFNWFLKDLESIQPGQYDVVMVDPVTDIEGGMVSYVRKHPTEFGYTSDQFLKGGGLIWGAVKGYWKIILSSVASRCQTFYYTAHMRSEWSGGVPTGNREPKGKDTLMELSSLYLLLDRSPAKLPGTNKIDPKAPVPNEPRAIVLKERLSDTFIDPESGELKIIKLLPPVLPIATVKAIRNYIANPPNYDELKPEEKFVPEERTEEKLLILRGVVADKEKEALDSGLATLEKKAKILALQQRAAAGVTQSSDRTATVNAAVVQKAADVAVVAKSEAKAEKKAEKASKAAADPEKVDPINEPKGEPAVAKEPAKAASTEAVVLEDTPDEKIPAEADRASKLELRQLKFLLDNIKWPEGKTNPDGSLMTSSDHVRNGLIRAGVPIKKGNPSPGLMSHETCDKLSQGMTKLLKRDGIDVDDILAKAKASLAAK